MRLRDSNQELAKVHTLTLPTMVVINVLAGDSNFNDKSV